MTVSRARVHTSTPTYPHCRAHSYSSRVHVHMHYRVHVLMCMVRVSVCVGVCVALRDACDLIALATDTGHTFSAHTTPPHYSHLITRFRSVDCIRSVCSDALLINVFLDILFFVSGYSHPLDTTQLGEEGAAVVTRFRVRKRIVMGNTSELLGFGAFVFVSNVLVVNDWWLLSRCVLS